MYGVIGRTFFTGQRSDSAGRFRKRFLKKSKKYIFIERTLFLTENRLAVQICKPIFIYCPLLQTTVLFAVPLKAAAKPSALRGQYERRLLVAKPPPAIHCRYCKIVDFAIEPSIKRVTLLYYFFSVLSMDAT